METATSTGSITIADLLKRSETWGEIVRLYKRSVTIAQIAELLLSQDAAIREHCSANKNPLPSLCKAIQYHINRSVPLQDRIERERLRQFMKDHLEDLDALMTLRKTITLQVRRAGMAHMQELKMGFVTEDCSRELRLLMDSLCKLLNILITAGLPLMAPAGNATIESTPEQEAQGEAIMQHLMERYGLSKEEALAQVLGIPLIGTEQEQVLSKA